MVDLPHKVLSPDFEDDIFINYAHLDNKALRDNFDGFVSKVHERLANRLAVLIGEEPKIWRDVFLEGTHQLTPTILYRISKTVFFVCVLSPSYVRSEWCRKELNEFYKNASEKQCIKINNRSRIFKIVKTPIAMDPRVDPFEETEDPKVYDEVRTILQESLGYEFFEFDEKGKLLEYSPEFGERYDLKHVEKIEDLAQDIVRFINDREFQRSFNAKCVYLAETTPELSDQRNEIRRNLQQHGYTVLPDENLPFETEAFAAKVSEYLKRSLLSVHLIGSDFTSVNSDLDLRHKLSADRMQRQHELAMSRGENDSEFVRLVWMPPGLVQREKVNQDFIAYLQNDPAVHENADILNGDKLEDVKTLLHKRLKITESPPTIKGKRVYLMCDKADTDAVMPLKDFLESRNHDVLLPFAHGNQMVRPHSENMRLCDAVLIFYGKSDTIDYKVKELRKLDVVRQSHPLIAKGIFISGPETDDKKRFTTEEALTMQCFGDFSPATLKPFLDELESSISASA